eukprot:SAG31_NODE_368_length_16798_cov_20.422780_15_plen_88_part_00
MGKCRCPKLQSETTHHGAHLGQLRGAHPPRARVQARARGEGGGVSGGGRCHHYQQSARGGWRGAAVLSPRLLLRAPTLVRSAPRYYR